MYFFRQRGDLKKDWKQEAIMELLKSFNSTSQLHLYSVSAPRDDFRCMLK